MNIGMLSPPPFSDEVECGYLMCSVRHKEDSSHNHNQCLDHVSLITDDGEPASGDMPWENDTAGTEDCGINDLEMPGFDRFEIQDCDLDDFTLNSSVPHASFDCLDYMTDLESGQRSHSFDLLPPNPFLPADRPTNATRITMYRGFTTLGLDEEMALRNIAMPADATTPCSQEPPLSRRLSTSSHSDNDQIQQYTNKRQKLVSSPSFGSTTTECSDGKGKIGKENELHNDQKDAVRKRKQGHNEIEKRYRSSLNDKILSLDRCIPHLPQTDDDPETGAVGGDGNQRRKVTKSAILTRAMQHIKTLETNKKRLVSEATALQVRIAAFEKLALARAL